MLTGIGSVNWNDPGMRQAAGLMTETADVLVHYQGGNDTGWTLTRPEGSYLFNLLPEGILHDGTVCVLGDGMVIDLDYLRHEISMMNYFHVRVTPENLKLSSRAAVCLPLHVRQDVLADQFYHASGRTQPPAGIAYAYADQITRVGLTLGDLLHLELPENQYRMRRLLAGKNLLMTRIYDQQPLELSEMLQWCSEQAKFFAPFICDTGAFIESADAAGKNVLFRAPLGALSDVSYGFYPNAACFHTLLGYAPICSGLPGRMLDRTIGVMSAVSGTVEDGPFPAGKAADKNWEERLSAKMQRQGDDSDAALRIGPFDAVATEYGVRCQHPESILLTGLNLLSGFFVIPIVTGYRYGGKTVQHLSALDAGSAIGEAEPIVTEVPGWSEDLTGISCFDQLPENAKAYIRTLEKLAGCRIGRVLTGDGSGSGLDPHSTNADSLS